MSVVVAGAAPLLDDADRAWIADATRFSTYAGPDGSGSHVTDSCGLGHALLRTGTRDVSQPLTLDWDVWLSADVRLDDRQTLLSGLRERGIEPPADASDAELVLHSYRAWGEQCVEHLLGDFAFALWDGRLGVLLCARDQLGVTPLHYAQLGDGVLVATVVDAPLLHPRVRRDLDDKAIADFVARGRYSDPGATAFADVRQLPPGHSLTWSRRNGVQIRRYWQLPEWPELTRLERREDYVERFRELFDRAVADRITSDRVATHLSGGMDSTSIAASACDALHTRGAGPGDLHAVTLALGNGSGDREGEYASLVAQALGIELDLVDTSQLEPFDPFAPPDPLTPEPTPYRRTSGQYQLAALPAQHARVALSGIGGDPLLMFVPWYWAEWIAAGQKRRLAQALIDRTRVMRRRPRPHVRVNLGHAWWRLTQRPAHELPDWLSSEAAIAAGPGATADSQSPAALDARSLATDPLWTGLCRIGDPSFSRIALKFRYPFLDLRLLGYALTLAPDPWFEDKRVLREAMRGRLPEPVRTRRKTALVTAPLPGATRATASRLAALVRETSDVDRYLDRDRLAAAALSSFDGTDHDADRSLSCALGLVHWLAHRRDPRSQLVNQQPGALASA